MNSKNNLNVCVWGTFDLLHKGHEDFLHHASNIGNLHVLVIPSVIKKINNGYSPLNNAISRCMQLRDFSKANNNLIS